MQGASPQAFSLQQDYFEGGNHDKDKSLWQRAAKVAQRYPGQVEVSTFDAISDEGRKYGVMFTPTVVVNDSIAAQGKVISEGELEKAIKSKLEGQP